MDFKDFLRIRRAELNISQTQLAERLSQYGQNTSQTRITYWETGRNQPPWEDANLRQALAGALELDINEMMARLGFIVTDDQRSNEARRAADIIDRLPERERKIALNLLDTFEKSIHKTS